MFFSFDAETDGLYGEMFAVGAVVMDDDKKIVDSFSGIAEAETIQDEWTLKNCIPQLQDLPIFPTKEALRKAFWAFYLKYHKECVIVADVPYPVEAHLLRQCAETNPENTFLGPYPLIDVASVFYANGIDPLTDRRAFCAYHGASHNPLADATASVLCLIKLLHARK